MKTYKTWEAYKMLTENPNLKFKDEFGYYLVIEDNAFTLKDELGKDVEYVCNTFEDKWTLVQNPVDFMTAVKSGEKIKVEHETMKSFEFKCGKEYTTLFAIFEELGKNLDSISIREILTEGKFYIEEQEIE